MTTTSNKWREQQIKMGQQFSGRCLDLDQERKKRRLSRLKKIGLIFGSFVLFVGLVFGVFLSQSDRLNLLMSTTSFVARLINPVELKETDGRVNTLVLGLDTRSEGGLLNTDTILIGSFSLTEGEPVLISIPRDLWVTFPKKDGLPNGRQGKINTPFSIAAIQSGGTVDDSDMEKGVAYAKETIENVLGIPIHYWVLVDFEGFKQIIDTLEGIKVCVERPFDDYQYPRSGMENAKLSQRYEHLHFDKGCRKMDGATALKYSRSRMGTNGEGSDFARARRQQKVIMAVKDKVLSLSLLFNPGKVVNLYKQFTKTVKTNASLAETQRALEILYDFQDLDKVETLVIDPESGLTYVPQNRANYGGAYVIVPTGDNFTEIHKALQKTLFGSANQKAGKDEDEKSKTE